MAKQSVIAPPARQLFADAESSRELSERKDAFVKAMTEATVAGLTGATTWDSQEEGLPVPTVKHNAARANDLRKALDDVEMAKSADMSALGAALTGSRAEILSKEWSLTNPISTGLVPFDLEAPAKLLTPRPTPLRNSIPRVKGQGASRRFKVISGFTGTGTGGATSVQPGINETTTNAGPGGLGYIRPPYINYDGYDVNLTYVSWGLSDSVSWQAQFGSAA